MRRIATRDDYETARATFLAAMGSDDRWHLPRLGGVGVRGPDFADDIVHVARRPGTIDAEAIMVAWRGLEVEIEPAAGRRRRRERCRYRIYPDLVYAAPGARGACVAAAAFAATSRVARADVAAALWNLRRAAWAGAFQIGVTGDAGSKRGGRLLKDIGVRLTQAARWERGEDGRIAIENVERDWGY